MKKTLTIRLGQALYSIEADAWKKLSALANAYILQSGYADASQAREAFENEAGRYFSENRLASDEPIRLTDIDAFAYDLNITFDYAEEVAADQEGDSGPQQQPSDGTTFKGDKDVWLAGVLGDLGRRWEVRPLYLRIAFLILVWLTGGWFAVTYLVLMFVIPNRSQDKSRGFFFKLRDDMLQAVSHIRAEFEKHQKAQSRKAQKPYQEPVFDTEARQESGFMQSTSEIRQGGRIFSSIFGALFFVIAMAGLSALVIAWLFGERLSFLLSDGKVVTGLETLAAYITAEHSRLLVYTLLLAVAIPFVRLLIGAVRMLFGITSRRTIAGRLVSVFGFVGFVLTAYLAAQIFLDFDTSETVTTSIGPVAGQQPTLVFKQAKIEGIRDVFPVEGNWGMYTDRQKHLHPYIEPDYVFLKGDSGLLIVLTLEARGHNSAAARENAQSMVFKVKSKDNTIYFPAFALFSNEGCWRDHSVVVEINIPENQSFVVESKLAAQMKLDTSQCLGTAMSGYRMTSDGPVASADVQPPVEILPQPETSGNLSPAKSPHTPFTP